MSIGELHSDHVNYLIFRYLQERGHENAATAFSREWHRPAEYRDPETLPFAHVVRRDELVTVIQDGLEFDRLSAIKRKNLRRFQWTGVNARDSIERQDGEMLENGRAMSRPSSDAKRRDRPPTMRAPDEFPTPAPKRQRRSEGSEGVHLNGERDAMDVDATSVDADEDGELVSPAVASPEGEVIEIAERYDSMDVATQTDPKPRPKTSTMYWKIDKPAAIVLHSVWNPDPDPQHAKILFTAGDSLCRFYQVPEKIDDAKQALAVEEPSLPANSIVTAVAWHPAGHTATCAVDTIRELPDRDVSLTTLIDHHRDTGASSQYLNLPLLDPPGIALALRHSEDGKHLLVVRSNSRRGIVLVYETAHAGPGSNEPIAWRIFEHQVLDAAWIANDKFIVCGDAGLVNTYRIDAARRESDSAFANDTIAVQGLIERSVILSPQQQRWDKVRVEHGPGIVAVASSAAGRVVLKSALPVLCDVAETEIDSKASSASLELPGQLTALAFQPDPPSLATHEREVKTSLLAVAFEEGVCSVYGVSVADGVECKERCTFHLSEGPALALSWSPDGQYLAVSGTDLVQIWSMDNLTTPSGSTPRPLITWRPSSKVSELRNGEDEDEKPLPEPSLSWSADGESLGFAVDRQIAVIRFRPPLRSQGQDAGTYEHGSP